MTDVDTHRAVPLRIVDDLDGPDPRPGDAVVMRRDSDDAAPPAGYAFRCPGCGRESWLSLNPPSPHDGPEGRPRWTVAAGDPRTGAGLSLTPSIHHAAHLGGCGWHGYLTNGVLSPC